MSDAPPGVVLREPVFPFTTARGEAVPLVAQPDWLDRFPWLVQGTTARGDDAPFDLGLAGAQPVAAALARWWALRDAVAMEAAVLARQVHGCGILTHDAMPPGLHLAPPGDGHVTAARGILLAVTVADCVPVSIVAEPRAIVLLHAGWRGIAAGILEAGLRVLAHTGRSADSVHVHFGPSICGACYEVGPEVHRALGLTVPAAASHVDLRAALARRAAAMGVPPTAISRSSWCTRCDAPAFFSHRAGDSGRQVGFLGIRRDA